jgi:hypothetical protein
MIEWWGGRFSNTSLLLHGDGANGSTSIIDSSSSQKTVTAVGNAKISTAIADPFGNTTRGVIAFDGTGDFLSLAPSDPGLDLGYDNCTIECWIYTISYATAAGTTWWPIVTKGAPYHTETGWTQSYVFTYSPQSGNRLELNHRNSSSGFVEGTHMFTKRSSALNLLHNTWYHVAAVREGSSVRLYLNGADVSDNSTGNYDWASFDFGLSSAQEYFNVGRIRGGVDNVFWDSNGYISEVRIKKNEAVYTANFTPPTAPFPND